MEPTSTYDELSARSGAGGLEAEYDAVVVGARVAGSATGMLLARQGMRVLVIDRAGYGSDTLSTHALMRAGVLQLQRWGLLDRVIEAGTPAVRGTSFHLADGTTDIEIKAKHGVDALYAPRRTVLDRIVADAAVSAGADVRFGVSMDALTRDATGRVTGISVRDRAGRTATVKSRITIGADGVRSALARAVESPVLLTGSGATAVVYGYWSDVGFGDSYHWHYRPGFSTGLIPTNGGTLVFAGTTPEHFRTSVKPDVSAGFRHILDEASPGAYDNLQSGRFEGRFRSFPGLLGFIRQAHGPGWALVGDAGYFKDPISAHGISDALRDAELLARAVRSAADDSAETDSMHWYQSTRDELSIDLFRAADEIAAAKWTDAEIPGLLERMSAGMRAELDVLVGFDSGADALPDSPLLTKAR